MFGAATITLSHKEAQKAQTDLLNQFALFVLLCGDRFNYLLGV